MLAPISWLKDYVEIKLPLKELMWKMTEVGLTCEAYHKTGTEIVLDVEVTPNRPDWLNIVGIAREIAAIQGIKIKTPTIKPLPTKSGQLPINVSVDSSLCLRYTGVTLAGVTVKDSPEWLKEKLRLVGLRPINNIVDITNFVMFELGVPIHAFDYDKFADKNLVMQKAKGGETFTSVDNLSYELTKDTIIIKNEGVVIDLCGLKGGANTGISDSTKNVYVHVPVYVPQMIRRTSQALKLSSEASYIYERGANSGGTMDTLLRTVELILKLAGGEIASDVLDVKKEKFNPRGLSLNLARLEKVLGIKVEDEKVLQILTSLNLLPKKRTGQISCLIPTYRGDLRIEEDLIEEVARIYGYNNFPKTLPVGETPKETIPYYFDDSFQIAIKDILKSAGFSEIMSYSLMAEDLLVKTKQVKEEHIRLSNPVSLDFEFLRTSLLPNLLLSVKANPGEKTIKLFEVGKTYLPPAEKAKEPYLASGVLSGSAFIDLKGIVDVLLLGLNIQEFAIEEGETNPPIWHPFKSAILKSNGRIIGRYGAINPQVVRDLGWESEIFGFEFYIEELHKLSQAKVFIPISKYPPQIEDMTLILPERTKVGDIIDLAMRNSKAIARMELTGKYEDAYTFRLWYQDAKKTLANEEVEKIRTKLITQLKEKLQVSVKN